MTPRLQQSVLGASVLVFIILALAASALILFLTLYIHQAQAFRAVMQRAQQRFT